MNLLLLRPNTANFAVPMILNGLRNDRRVGTIYQFPRGIREFEDRSRMLPNLASPSYDDHLIASEREARRLLKSGAIQGVVATNRYFDLRPRPGRRLRDTLQRLAKHAFPFSSRRRDIGATFLLHWRDARRNIPVAIVDCRDNFTIREEDVELLRLCCAYFKRELPFNRFNLFRPYAERLSRAEILDLSAKVRPIPLGVDDALFEAWARERRAEKASDLFWSGKPNASQRLDLPERLREIAARRGLRLDLADGRLSFEEYRRRIASSKICVSVEGAGWDCYRHAEAIALGSIPMINEPTVDAAAWRAAPREIFFRNDFSDFEEKLLVLTSNDRLREELQTRLDAFARAHLFWSRHAGRVLEALRASSAPRPAQIPGADQRKRPIQHVG
ncbi:MAG: hypothetical protein HUU04_02070 [Verrucomicrobiae bacterium]|nr:hypothetical protein [Verrucomicrobiae bacterium]